MTSRRKHRLLDCSPHYVEDGKGAICAVYFECPEGHDGCRHVIPFAPALDGTAGNWNNGGSGAIWQRSGPAGTHVWGFTHDEGSMLDAGVCSKCMLASAYSALPCVPFETLSLSPSIRRVQRHASKEAALAAGVLEEHFSETLTCALHIFITNGAIEFCGDSL